MIILLHSSKTMQKTAVPAKTQQPRLLSEAEEIATYLKSLTTKQLAKSMKISDKKAETTANLIQDWSGETSKQSLAIDAFKGDIYSGLQAPQLTKADREYANKNLYILSGLYGFIRPLDSISPYRLEMAYKFPDPKFSNFYNYWSSKVADCLPKPGLIINTSSVEYSKIITPFVDAERIITPQFFTVSPTTGKPTFVTVHSKIARGAFARWLILNRADDTTNLKGFDLLGYQYNNELSLPSKPAFVTKDFGGIGLSIRTVKPA